MTQTATASRNAQLRAQHALTPDELGVFLDCGTPARERDPQTPAAEQNAPGSAAVGDEQR